MNIVPTPKTRAVARRMVKTATEETGPDAVVRHLAAVDPDQLPALVGVLLNTVKVNRKPGRPRMPLQLSEKDRLKGYSLYRQGVKNDFTRMAYREYQRVSQQRRRDAGMDRERARRQPVLA